MSRVPQEWNRDPWFMGRQETFKDYATSDVFPRWLRVVWAAYSQLAANGHAQFRQQELAGILGEEINGIWLPAKRQRVREAIDGAIDRHLLLDESKALCLVVPRAAIAFGAGKADAPCRRHPQPKRNARTVSPGVETTRFQPVVSSQKERSERVVSGGGLYLSRTQPESRQRPAS